MKSRRVTSDPCRRCHAQVIGDLEWSALGASRLKKTELQHTTPWERLKKTECERQRLMILRRSWSPRRTTLQKGGHVNRVFIASRWCANCGAKSGDRGTRDRHQSNNHPTTRTALSLLYASRRRINKMQSWRPDNAPLPSCPTRWACRASSSALQVNPCLRLTDR